MSVSDTTVKHETQTGEFIKSRFGVSIRYWGVSKYFKSTPLPWLEFECFFVCVFLNKGIGSILFRPLWRN